MQDKFIMIVRYVFITFVIIYSLKEWFECITDGHLMQEFRWLQRGSRNVKCKQFLWHINMIVIT